LAAALVIPHRITYWTTGGRRFQTPVACSRAWAS
jgi:hypothetical protein